MGPKGNGDFTQLKGQKGNGDSSKARLKCATYRKQQSEIEMRQLPVMSIYDYVGGRQIIR